MAKRMWQKGFTLIELILVVSLIGIIFGLTVMSYSNFSEKQTMKAAASELRDAMQLAKSRAVSQVKPEVCGNEVLDGYKVELCGPGSCLSSSQADYEVQVVCGGTEYLVDPIGNPRRLPPNITIDENSTQVNEFFFRVLNRGVEQPGSIGLKGYGKEATVQVDQLGNISVIAL